MGIFKNGTSCLRNQEKENLFFLLQPWVPAVIKNMQNYNIPLLFQYFINHDIGEYGNQSCMIFPFSFGEPVRVLFDSIELVFHMSNKPCA